MFETPQIYTVAKNFTQILLFTKYLPWWKKAIAAYLKYKA